MNTSSFLFLTAAEIHVQVHRVVSVDNMATVVEEFITEEQNILLRVFKAKTSIQGLFIRKYFLFTAGCACGLVRFANEPD
jgi:hypothetical protein